MSEQLGYYFGTPTILGGGVGTVTSVAVATANGVSGVVLNDTTTPSITLTLGAITPSSVASAGAISGTTLTASGITTTAGRIRALAAKTTTYTILTSDDVIVGNHATIAFTITLPTLASSPKSQFTIKNKGAAVVTLDGDGAETIDGNANFALAQYDSVTVINDTTQWLII